MTEEDRVAQAIFAAQWGKPELWLTVCEDERGYYRRAARAAIEALSADGHSIIQLPEPDEDGEWDGQDSDWWVSTEVIRSGGPVDGRVRVKPHLFRRTLHPNAARRFAAALLAAAAAAESRLPVVEQAGKEQPQ